MGDKWDLSKRIHFHWLKMMLGGVHRHNHLCLDITPMEETPLLLDDFAPFLRFSSLPIASTLANMLQSSNCSMERDTFEITLNFVPILVHGLPPIEMSETASSPDNNVACESGGPNASVQQHLAHDVIGVLVDTLLPEVDLTIALGGAGKLLKFNRALHFLETVSLTSTQYLQFLRSFVARVYEQSHYERGTHRETLLVYNVTEVFAKLRRYEQVVNTVSSLNIIRSALVRVTFALTTGRDVCNEKLFQRFFNVRVDAFRLYCDYTNATASIDKDGNRSPSRPLESASSVLIAQFDQGCFSMESIVAVKEHHDPENRIHHNTLKSLLLHIAVCITVGQRGLDDEVWRSICLFVKSQHLLIMIESQKIWIECVVTAAGDKESGLSTVTEGDMIRRNLYRKAHEVVETFIGQKLK